MELELLQLLPLYLTHSHVLYTINDQTVRLVEDKNQQQLECKILKIYR